MENQTFKDLVDELGNNALSKWSQAKISEKDEQFDAKLDFESVKRIYAYCKSHINAGENAKKELETLVNEE